MPVRRCLLSLVGLFLVCLCCLCSSRAYADVGDYFVFDDLTFGATTITFDQDDLGNLFTAPQLFSDTTALNELYAPLGVHFQGPYPGFGGAILSQSSNFNIAPHSGTNFLAFNREAFLADGSVPTDPETISFDQPVSDVSIYAAGGFAPEDFQMTAYDAGGNLLGVTGATAWGYQQLSFSHDDIASVVLTETPIVPEPGAWIWLGAAALGVVALGRRRVGRGNERSFLSLPSPLGRHGGYAAFALFLLVGCLRPASAQVTTIGFDNLADGMAVTNQYHSQGIDFDSGGATQPVTAMKVSGAPSPPNVLNIVVQDTSEFKHNYVEGVFTNPHHHSVSVQVANSFADDVSVTLNAYDLSGNLVAATTGTAGGNTFNTLSVTSSAGKIARFEVTRPDSDDELMVDNVAFDTLSTAQPDFSLLTSDHITLTPGGSSGSATVTIRRFAGSTGAITLSASQLPSGVSANISPNPFTGPDGGTVTVSLQAAASALPSAGSSFTLTGSPAPSAGQYGSHAISIPVTVLDAYDAQVAGIEVTQAVQQYDLPRGSLDAGGALTGAPVAYPNDAAGLAQDVRTTVRVFAGYYRVPYNPGGAPAQDCLLYGTATNQFGMPMPLPGSPLHAENVPAPLARWGNLLGGQDVLGPPFVTDDQRAAAGSAFKFTLPSAWTEQGSINLTATISQQPVLGGDTYVDTNAADNAFTLTGIPFYQCTRTLNIAPVAMQVTGLYLSYPDNVFSDAQNIVPVPPGMYVCGNYRAYVDINDIWNNGDDSTQRGDECIHRLRDVGEDFNLGEDNGAAVIGICPDSDAQANIRSSTLKHVNTQPYWNDDKLDTAVVQAFDRPLSSAMHELGHMLGRLHASSAGGADDPQDWPPDEQGWLDSVGYDWRSNRVLFADRTPGDLVNLGGPYYDYMGYLGQNSGTDPDKWVSLRGWNYLVSIFTGASLSANVAPVGGAAGNSGPVLSVQASITPAGVVTITKVAPTGNPVSAPDPNSPYHLVLRDAAGHILSDTSLLLGEEHMHLATDYQALAARVPDSHPARVEIYRGNQLVAARSRSAHAPVVQNVTVTPDVVIAGVRSMRITWSASDADHDPLMTKIDYSTDGGTTWRPLFFGPNHNQAILPATLFTVCRSGKVRLRVGDGFNETTAASNAFTAQGNAPHVQIVVPTAGNTIRQGAMLYLSGTAYDDAYQPLTGAQLTWYQGAQVLGTGNQISVTGLPLGPVNIQLTATDSLGRSASKTVRVTITP